MRVFVSWWVCVCARMPARFWVCDSIPVQWAWVCASMPGHWQLNVTDRSNIGYSIRRVDAKFRVRIPFSSNVVSKIWRSKVLVQLQLSCLAFLLKFSNTQKLICSIVGLYPVGMETSKSVLWCQFWRRQLKNSANCAHTGMVAIWLPSLMSYWTHVKKTRPACENIIFFCSPELSSSLQASYY